MKILLASQIISLIESAILIEQVVGILFNKEGVSIRIKLVNQSKQLRHQETNYLSTKSVQNQFNHVEDPFLILTF
jgi:hypothetical protein